jgi:glutamate dehydrogenase
MKNMMTSLTQAFEARLLDGALPGELEGLEEGERAEAARYVAETAAIRSPGKPQIRLETYLDEERRQMRLAVVNDDRPFLVDSIAAAIAAHDIAIYRIIHPVIPVQRDAEGKLISIGDGQSESMVYIEMERGDARTRRALIGEIEQSLEQVRSAVEDWPALRAAMALDAERCASTEAAALLRWFAGGAMTLLARAMAGGRQRVGPARPRPLCVGCAYPGRTLAPGGAGLFPRRR